MSKNRRGITLEKKLAAYSLAGAAAFIVPGAAKADIVYVPNVDTVVNQPGTYDFNLSGPSSDDITLTAEQDTSGTDPINEVDFSTNAAAQVQLGYFFSASDLAFGALIDPSTGAWGSSGKLVSYDTVTGDTEGFWPTNGDTGYLAFYFGAAGSPQAGWAQIATTDGAGGASFEVLDYAYETNPNMPIAAGQTAETPEPSTLPLLILGGAGLIALRRRRAAHV